MVEYIRQIITKPMTARTPKEEAIGILIILLYCLAVWAVSELVYYIENRRNKKK